MNSLLGLPTFKRWAGWAGAQSSISVRVKSNGDSHEHVALQVSVTFSLRGRDYVSLIGSGLRAASVGHENYRLYF